MFLMVSRDNQSSAKTSKGKNISGRSAGRIQEIEYHHKFGLYQWKANEVFGWRFLSWKRIFTEATTQHSRTDARFFRWLKPHVEIYYKGIMMLLPLNYWWKGLSAWWSCFFNDRWFDKEQALCIVLHFLAKSERGLAGRRNSVKHGNVSGIWFHIKGFVYDNHMPATFLLTASCCAQIREQFLTCRFQVTISISTWLFLDTVHVMKNLKKTFAWSEEISLPAFTLIQKPCLTPLQLIEKFHGVYCIKFKRKRRNVKKISILRRS